VSGERSRAVAWRSTLPQCWRAGRARTTIALKNTNRINRSGSIGSRILQEDVKLAVGLAPRVDQLAHVLWCQFSCCCTSFQMSSSIGFVSFAQILFAHHAEEHRAVHFSSMRCLKNKNFFIYLFIFYFSIFFFFFFAFIKFCSTTISVLSATLRVEMRERFATNRTFHTFTVAIGNNIEAFGAFKHVRVACLRGDI
jgi:hypothetical protein